MKQAIEQGKTILGIELGSTRIKSVLIGEDFAPIASGGYDWENKLENGIWTYDLPDVWTGLQASFRSLREAVERDYGCPLSKVGAIGISGMMVGYLVFDKDEHLLTPFRTWRNNMTLEASEQLTELFEFNIPQRWSIAHLYQCMLDGDEHVRDIAFLTTLSGYVHYKLTGKKVVGIDDASGILPIDSDTCDYDAHMVERFNGLLEKEAIPWTLRDILPAVLVAGDQAGTLTEAGARLLDPAGQLEVGIPLCPPEGDGGTGMVATNSIGVGTCNVSAGTSVFAMVVLGDTLPEVNPVIEVFATPEGRQTAMVHGANCTSDLNAWVGLFAEFTELLGTEIDKSRLYELLFNVGLKGDPDGGGLLAYNYDSGEHITHFIEGRPMFVRKPGSQFNLANFMRTHLYSALATFRLGVDILTGRGGVTISQVVGHGGFFKTEGVGQRIMAAIMNAPVTVLETAGEGGAWGIALLASYMIHKEKGESLETYLADKVFAGKKGRSVKPDPADVEGFNNFLERYKKGLAIERAAVESLD